MCVCVCVHSNGDGLIIVSGRRLKGLDLYTAMFTDIRIIGQKMLYAMYICVCWCVCANECHMVINEVV